MKKLVAHLRTKLGSSVAFGSYEFFISSEKLSKVRLVSVGSQGETLKKSWTANV